MKKCHKCKKDLPLENFSKNKAKPDGLGTECKSCRKLYMTSYYRDNHDKMNERNGARGKQRHQEAKLACLKYYSKETMQCECCPEKHIEFLSIDHIDGGGNKERKSFKGARTFYEYLVKNDFPPGLRVLCYNCNLSLGFFGYCPHQKVDMRGTI